ncbi:MAG: hypothetical protein VX257_04705, partial [Planctomycetota bacterium]|nr:hypothetical protein [Planctomycetota bacterium]
GLHCFHLRKLSPVVEPSDGDNNDVGHLRSEAPRVRSGSFAESFANAFDPTGLKPGKLTCTTCSARIPI